MNIRLPFKAGLLVLSLVSTLAIAETVIPDFSPNVVDPNSYLSEKDKSRINQKLQEVRESADIWGAVYIVSRLENESIEELAERAFRKWELGRTGADNGVLLLLAVEERRSRLEVGYGLEGTLTDAVAGFALDHKLAPRMRGGDMVSAVTNTFNFLSEVAQGRPTALQEIERFSDEEFSYRRAFTAWGILVFLIWTLMPFTRFYTGRKKKRLFSKHPDLSPQEDEIAGNKDFVFKFVVPIFLTINPGIFVIILSGMFELVYFGCLALMALISWGTVNLSSKKFRSRKNYLAHLEAQRLGREELIKKGHLEMTSDGKYRYTPAYYASRRSSSSSSSFSSSSSSSSSGGGRSGGGGASSSW